MIQPELSTVIFLIDSRGVIHQDDQETITRHGDYAIRLKMFEADSCFRIISASEKSQRIHFSSKFVIDFVKSNKRFSFLYICKAFSIIKSSKSKNFALVAGDPWEATLSAFILRLISKFFLGLDVAVQIQIHADITDTNWQNQNIVNQFRSKIAFFSLRIADQIRVMSNNQKAEILNVSKLKKKQVFVSPVSLNIPDKNSPLFASNRPKSIGFAGRFQMDRGLADLLAYIEKLASVDSGFKVILAGSGPKLDVFLSDLYKIIPRERVSHLGFLQSNEMINFWSQVGVYLSTAKSESYGRSIREATYFGIPVLAIPSNGFSELLDNKLPWVTALNIKQSPNEIANQFEVLCSIETDETMRNRILADWKVNQNQVVLSWVELLSLKSPK